MKKSIFIGSIVALMLLSTAISAKAFIPGPGTQVAIVPDPTSTNGGTLPSTDPAFANFTFTNLPWANVNAGNLTAYNIVVLLIDAGASNPALNPQQASDLMNWVNTGGKLIIYDSEMGFSGAIDYSWLVYPFTTNSAGAQGAVGELTYLEDNALGSNNPSSPNFVNITQQDVNVWLDAVGDSNVFATQDVHWCGHIEAININGITGWVHTYAVYGSGMMLYNGFDIDYLTADMIPGTVGIYNLAKLWLLELTTPWGTDYNLACGRKVVVTPVGGEIIEGPALSSVILITLSVTAAIATIALLSKKLLRTRIPKVKV
jgi:hypothetical protein